MSQPSGLCPNCGAQIHFRFAQAVQTTCEFCKSILVRTDVTLEKVGEVAALLPEVSPIQLGTDGVYRDKPFVVVGRISYEWEQGAWNEWHLAFTSGGSGWLSDAQAEYAVTFVATPEHPLPTADQLHPGLRLSHHGVEFQATTITEAGYIGVQGELPFKYWDKGKVKFGDLRSNASQFATIDYSDTPALLFIGEQVEFDSLKLKNLRSGAAGPAAKAAGFNCPNCGSAIELKTGALAANVACSHCASIIDLKDPNLKVLHQFEERMRFKPTIALGAKGNLKGDVYELVGFQVRENIPEEDDPVERWNEYVLFHATKGFRYLSESKGKWSFIATLPGIPQQGNGGVRWNNRNYRLLYTEQAKTIFVLGEFPWQVRVGESVVVTDFGDERATVSLERTENEETWSLGQGIDGQSVWKAFNPQAANAPAAPPPPVPSSGIGPWRLYFLQLLGLIAIFLATTLFTRNEIAFDKAYTFSPANRLEASFVTEPFELKGRTCSVEIDTSTDLNNNWAYFNYALIASDSGKAWSFGRDVSYYRDSDESEGSKKDSIRIGEVPPARYYLRVEPEMDSKETAIAASSMNYRIRVRRDVPGYAVFFLAAFALMIPAIFWSLFRAAARKSNA